MIPQTPEILLTPLVIDGDKSTIPVETPAGTPDFSISSGFPQITSIEKKKGGIAPRRIDFNAVFNLLSIHTYFLQSGCQYTYNPALDYIFGSMVLGSDRALYFCIFPNGPEAGAGITHDPVNSPDYWRMIITADGKLNIDLSDNNISGTLPIERGGTGANNAGGAWENIGGGNLGKLDSIAITDSKITGNLPAARVSGLAKVATSGSYNDLTNKPANNGAPLPVSNTSNPVGSWVNISYLGNWQVPAGGSWAICIFTTKDGGVFQCQSGIYAGGTVINTALNWCWGFAWRIQ